MPTPKIKDIAVAAQVLEGINPVGEAPKKGETLPSMGTTDRVNMEERLFNQIDLLMDKANDIHTTHCKADDSNQVNPDYITRLSTNEFFFYTQEPLTLDEFERLQDKIADKAAMLPDGIHLVLGSFAVKNDQNQVMNVTPHITCGPSPNFNFIVKNYTSAIDVRYKEPTADGSGNTLPMLDKWTAGAEPPAIKVKGVDRRCSFDNVIPCTTPSGAPFITAIDVCLDHYYATAKQNIDTYVETKKPEKTSHISHMIVSMCSDNYFCV